MKRLSVPALIVLILSLVIAVGGRTFLAPCIHEDGTEAVCAGAGRMLSAVGCLCAVMAVLAFVFVQREARKALFISIIAAAVMGLAIPGKLLSICRMSTMRCQAVMKPGMMILFGLAAVTALLGCVLER